jgi:hypothetical protein
MRKLLVAASVLTIITALGWPATAVARAPGGSLSIAGGSRSVGSPALGSAVDLVATYWDVRKQDTVRVQVLCLQNGGVVYGDNRVLTQSPSAASFVLGSPANGTSVWGGGSASCRADLYVVGSAGRVIGMDTAEFSAIG